MSLSPSDQSILLLDGGFGTTLEDVFAKDISGALWSASLVDKDPESIVNAHLAFLDAGSDAILTSTYQCAFETFDRAGYSKNDALHLMRKSVRLAARAKEKYQNDSGKLRQIQVVLSLGPFGATLSPAQEFDGIYPPPYGPRGFSVDGVNTNAFEDSSLEEVAVNALAEFHYERLRVFADDGEDGVWSLIDTLAFETVPLAREIVAIRRAMLHLASHLSARGLVTKPWFISTVWPSGIHPQEATPGGAHLGAEKVAYALLSESGATDKPDVLPIPTGIGINCTHIKDLDAVVGKLRLAVDKMKPRDRPSLVLYPNGGNVYDIVNHSWIHDKDDSDSEEARQAWALHLASIVEREEASRLWKGILVGGCCKTGPAHIELLCTAVKRTLRSKFPAIANRHGPCDYARSEWQLTIMDPAEQEKRTSDVLLATTEGPRYHSATRHSFLQAARSRTLNNDLLSLWLSQDRIYAAHAYPRFIGALIAKIPFSSQHGIGSAAEAKNQHILSVLSYSLQNVVREANFFLETSQRYGLDLESWKERAATKAYCAEMAHVASWGSLEDGLVFLWAMEKLYLDSWSFVYDGLSAETDEQSNASRAVSEFAKNWTNDEFVKFVEELRTLVDTLDIVPGSELWTRAKLVWDRVIELEIDFWPQAGEEVQARLDK